LPAGKSYTALTVERLCVEAGVSRGTFYLYFEDMRDLLSQLAESLLHELGDTASFWWHLPAGTGKQALRDAFASMFALYREHRGVLGSISEVAAHDLAMSERLAEILASAIAETAGQIRQTAQHGGFRSGHDPVLAAEWLCWMLERGLYEVAHGSDEQQLEPLLDALTGMVWNVLYRGTARDG
jgi:AcrR family transcriptional regulator